MTAKPSQLDFARNEAACLAEKADTLRGKTDPNSLRSMARLLLGVSYSADLLEKHGPGAERSHWHHVGTDAEKRASEALLRLARRGRNRQRGMRPINGGRA